MKIPIALKLDFKIDEKWILRIFDIGDGLGAGASIFKDIPIAAIMLRDLQAANNSVIASAFGELPFDVMQPQTMHIPIIQRRVLAGCSGANISDLSESNCDSLLPYSYATRVNSYVSHFWHKKLGNVVKTPPALIGMEVHKLLWYVLMQKHMSFKFRDNILYWSNDNPNTKADLSTINMTNGVFIKIADCSIGCGNDVYYAKNDSEVSKVLSQLYRKYQSSNEPSKKHIFVIEPAYQTIKSHNSKNYNVTGRAFVTLIFDTVTRELQVKIAGAKWMFPSQPLQKDKTQEQMLSNVNNCNELLPLSVEELDILSQQIVEVYGDIFIASIEHDNLIEYCNQYSIVREFNVILNTEAPYRTMIKSNKPKFFQNDVWQDLILMQLINCLIAKQYLPPDLSKSLGHDDEIPPYLSIENFKSALVRKICYLSFFESYAKFVKTCEERFTSSSKVIILLENESLITSKLDNLIKEFLKLKNKTYDQKDMNRALRQAANICDIEVLKLLIGTNRANVDDCSPKTQQTALHFAYKSKSSSKESCIQLLKLNSSQRATSFPELSQATTMKI